MRATHSLAALVVLAVYSFTAASANATDRCMTLYDAAHEALDEAMLLSEEFEYGGVLYQVDGCHYFSEPQTSEEEGTLQIRAQYPRGAEIAGFYHTHLDRTFNSSWFSGVDVQMHRDLRAPAFMGDMRTGKKYELVYKKFHYSYYRTGVKGTPLERPLVAAAQ